MKKKEKTEPAVDEAVDVDSEKAIVEAVTDEVVAIEETESLVDEVVEEAAPEPVEGEGSFLIDIPMFGRKFRCEDNAVDGEVKKLRYRLPVDGVITITRLE